MLKDNESVEIRKRKENLSLRLYRIKVIGEIYSTSSVKTGKKPLKYLR
jgi:hypothetical protein